MRFRLSRSLILGALLLAVASAAHAGANKLVSVTQIPLSDWLNAQTGTLVAFQGRTSSSPFSPLSNLGVVDYAGQRANANHLSFGFSCNGSIKLTEYADGTGDVEVNLNFSNAINWTYNPPVTAVIFGYTPGELAANSSLSPALASGHLQAKYTVPDASHAQLDLGTVTFYGGGTLSQIKFHSVAQGALRAAFGVPEGTPGQCNEENTGLFLNVGGGGGATADAYPCEKVEVKAVGGGASAGRSVGTLGAQPAGITAASAPARSSWGAIKALYH